MKIRVGMKVKHNNLVCIVQAVEGSDLEVKPYGTNHVYSVPASMVDLILEEGKQSEDTDQMLNS